MARFFRSFVLIEQPGVDRRNGSQGGVSGLNGIRNQQVTGSNPVVGSTTYPPNLRIVETGGKGAERCAGATRASVAQISVRP